MANYSSESDDEDFRGFTVYDYRTDSLYSVGDYRLLNADRENEYDDLYDYRERYHSLLTSEYPESSSDDADDAEVVDVCAAYISNTDSDALISLNTGLQRLQSENTLCDVTIKIGAKEFPAHKNMLAASSGYFKTVFTSGSQEAGTVEVTVEGESMAFEVLLRYIYAGEMNKLTNENASDVLRMVCYLDLAPHALQECKRLIACMFRDQSISIQEAFKISIRPEPELCDITKAAKWYINHSFTDFVEKPGFLEETTYDCINMFLDNINMIKKHKNEREIFLVITKWLKHNWAARKQYAHVLLTRIHLDDVSADELKSLLEEDMSDVTECRELLTERMKTKEAAVRSSEQYSEYSKRLALNHRKIRKQEHSQLISRLSRLSPTANAFQQYRGSGLKSLQSKNTLSDVTINVGSKSFHVHKNILAASSDYFMGMFTSGFQESESDVVSLSEGDGEIFHAILDFIYSTDKIKLTTANVVEVLKLAIYLQIESVVKSCIPFLNNELIYVPVTHHSAHLDTSTCSSVKISLQQAFEIAQHPDPCLYHVANLAKEYIVRNFIFFSEQPEFMEKTTTECMTTFIETYLCKLHHRADRYNRSEGEEVFEIVSEWICYDVRQREQFAVDCLKRFRLGLIPSATLQKAIDNGISDIPECKSTLEEVIALQTQSANLTVPPPHITHPHWFPKQKSQTLIHIGGKNMANQSIKYWKDTDWDASISIQKVPRKIRNHSVEVIDGYIYIAGGYGPNVKSRRCYKGVGTCLNRFDFYDMEQQVWQSLAPMTTARANFALVHLKHFVYAIGGERQDIALSDVECYSLVDRSWQCNPPLPIPIYSPSAVVYKGKILVYGRKGSLQNNYTLQIFTPEETGSKIGGHWSIALDAQQHAPRSPNTPKYVLTVQNNKVYRVIYNNRLGRVAELECDFDCKPSRVHIGATEDQTRLRASIVKASLLPKHAGRNIFSINKELYANVLGCIYKMGVTDSEEDVKVNSKKIERLGLEDNAGCVALVTLSDGEMLNVPCKTDLDQLGNVFSIPFTNVSDLESFPYSN
ncbi:uncharacterized protein [Amphiura filiformis]|uniref:uncharacterized protein isoform X2 n=1 Tax=Amphiura filiformis TaxID=82378 RepID=UPI003B221D2D